MSNTVTTPTISFRWDDRRQVLIVTTKAEHYELDAGQAMELADLLDKHRTELFRACFDLPDWITEKKEA